LSSLDSQQLDDAKSEDRLYRTRQKLLEEMGPADALRAERQLLEEAERQKAQNRVLQKHYENAHPYQDDLLEVIIELYDDLGGKVEELSRIRPPAFCGNQTVRGCAASLRAAKRDDLSASIELFRKKAAFVDDIERQLDDIDDPRAKGYMVCRAAIAAKIDHDMTPVDKQPGTPESERRRLDFFQTSATVGMD